MRHIGGAGVGARRGDVDDPSPAGLEHVGQHRLNGVEDPVEVHVDYPLPSLERDVVKLLEPVEAGRIHQYRDRPEPAADRCQGGIDLCAVRDVGGKPEVVVGGLQIDGRDIEAVGAEPPHAGQADTGSSTGDDRGLHSAPSTRNVAVSVTKNLPYNYENLTLTPRRRASSLQNGIRPAQKARIITIGRWSAAEKLFLRLS